VLAVYAIVGFALFAALGAYVATRTPTRLDVEAVSLRGVGVPLAVLFTSFGYWPALTVFGAATVVLLYDRTSYWLPAALVASHTLSQIVIAAIKPIFHRTRPDYWLIRHEVDTSYPSGHSATAMTFYLALLLLVWNVRLPHAVQLGASIVLGLCVIGIPWSRLALGAHYLTDVTGGALFGSAWLAASIALWTRFGPR